MLQGVDVELPSDIGEAVREQIALTLRPPYEAPITVAVNGALMSSAWFFLPTSLRDKLFTVHGTLAFALVLAAWMYSDVPSTNVLGPDARRSGAAVDDPVMFRRLILAKSIVLWLLVTPVCALVALVSGLANHSLLSTWYTIVLIGVFPFGFLAISAWVGIVFPYHPMPLRYRWEHRKPRKRMLVRWGVLVVTPYVVVPLLGVLLMTPSLLIWGFTAPHGLTQKVPDGDFGVGVAVACVITLACAVGGHRASAWIARRRRARLLDFLADPVRG
jgi:polyferredoxin